MDKKSRKAIKDLAETVTESRKRDAKLFESWAERIVEALESQAESNRELVRALQSRSGAPERGEGYDESPPAQSTAASADHEDAEEHEVTDAAERKAEELSVDLDEVEGTGAGGRVLVKDVEETAD